MTKATGTYASLIKGVSQQAPADRLEGQHGEQINMLSDPVRGLVRRNGMVLENQLVTPALPGVANATIDSFSYRTYSMRTDGRDLDLIYRSRPVVGGWPGANHLDGLMVYDKTPDDSRGWKTVVTDPTDDDIRTYMEGGVSALTALGAYVIFAGKGVRPQYATSDQMVGQAWSNYGAVWVRGGAYARTYHIRAKKASTGAVYTAWYTTMASAYPGSLDTSGLTYTDPLYQKYVNDLTFAYNTAVNQWIGDASEDIVPSNIAQKLVDALTAAGFTGWTRNGSHIGNSDVAELEVTDGGDGSLLVSLLSTTSAADEVTDMHLDGKVVKVQPKTADGDSFYLKAYAKDAAVTAGLVPVIWREAAGVVQTPTLTFAIGTFYGGVFYVASTPTKLSALILAETGDTLDVPGYVPSIVGDTSSVVPPHFFTRYITALGVFQDRLVVVSDAVVNMSRPGDYFNFYRSSVLTVADDDPIEVSALGTEGDTIRQATVYDRNLLMIGDKAHYVMNGRVVQTPATAAIAVLFALDNTAGAVPVGTGRHVFSLKEDSQLAACRLMQTQAGLFQDAPQVGDVSEQLRDYINGTPAEMVALSSPDMVFVRTEHFLRSTGAFPRARPTGLYLYQFMDSKDGQRLTDSWSAWEWSLALGTPIGLSAAVTGDGIMLYTLAWGTDADGSPIRAVLAMVASARTDPTGLPYLDGLRRADVAAADGLLTAGAPAAVRAVTYTAAGAAYSNSMPSMSDADRFGGLEHPHYTLGDAPPETVDQFRWTGAQGNQADYIATYPTGNTGDLWTGTHFPAFVDLTPPFVRHRNGRVRNGRLTLTKLVATLTRTAGFDSTYIDHIGAKQATHFAGEFERVRYDVSVWVGRDTRQVQVRLGAKDWLPLTINALAWSGQWFESK